MGRNISGIQNRPARRNGVRYLVGSSITNEEPTKPAQVPLISVTQLQPSHAEIVRAEDALQPRLVVRDGKKKRAPRNQQRPPAAHKRYGYSRAEVAALLDKPGVAEALPQALCEQFRRLAARNVTMSDLATENHLSEIAMEELVGGFDGWESRIIATMCKLYPGFKPYSVKPGRDGEKTENETEAAQDADIVKTGGGSIGGRIISGGKNPTTGRPRKLSDLERSGQIRETKCEPDYDRSGDKISEEDDYSEESGA